MGLEILKYDPNDYKISNVLSSGNGDLITNQEEISKVFTLFFQWKEQSPTWVNLSPDKRNELIRCKIDFDREERFLTQLYVEKDLLEEEQNKYFENLFIKLVVFEVCFEFESKIIEEWVENNKQHFIIEVPKELKFLKTRKSPRGQQTSTKLLATLNNENKNSFEVTELGLNSVVGNIRIPKGTVTQIKIEDLSFNAVAVRNENELTYFNILFNDDEETGIFFDIYKRYRYPNLANRSKYSIDKILELYDRSGFFGNFSGSLEEEDKLQKIKETWSNVKSIEHKIIADYCIEKQDNIIGASSLGKCFSDEDKESWVFHQLCADKEQSTLDDTCDLYCWRAEYLWSRKKKLNTLFWFRSESRWLERIYVKFQMQNPQISILREAKAYSYIHKTDFSKESKARVDQHSEYKRSHLYTETIEAAAGPDYIHANRNMNIIVSKDGNWLDVQNAANEIGVSLNKETIYFRVDLPSDSTLPENIVAEKQNGSDRFASIEKEGMLDFIACIKHSIAVTKKKKGVA